MANTSDVLVVGAGPTGLTLASASVSRGMHVTVVDRQAAGAIRRPISLIGGRAADPRRLGAWPLVKNFSESVDPCTRHSNS